jgi:hypothetical protein
LVAATTKARDVDGGPSRGAGRRSAAITIEAGDVDGGPPRGCYREFWLRPPPMLKTSTVGPWRMLAVGLAAVTTEARDIDGRPPRSAGDRSGSGHHRSWRRRW